MKFDMPYAAPGQKIGLLGGSFDPPHVGHLHISRAALKRFGLDQVWWLVTPGNPLKSVKPASMDRRLAAARALVQHPKIKVTDFERQVGTRYTAQTLEKLFTAYPRARFTWLMGADSLAQFHLWEDWQGIFESIPIGVLARPGQRISARLSPAAKIYHKYRLRGRESRLLARTPAPAWSFVNLSMRDVSSSEIRARGDWAR